MSEDACYQPQLKSVDDALQTLLTGVTSVDQIENVSLSASLGRVLASSISNPVQQPQWPIAAMDGFACHTDGLKMGKPLDVVGKSLAGTPYKSSLQRDQAVIITTGACVPDGADVVVMKEQCKSHDNQVTIPDDCEPGKHIRRVGSELAANTHLIHAGETIGPHHIGLIASLGMSEVSVYRPLKVGLFTTGDELVPPGTELDFGQIYDSNRYALNAVLKAQGFEVIDYGLIEDDPKVIELQMITASEEVDVLITTGGVSVGEADHIVPILNRIGQLQQWKLAIKPGKPIAIGHINDCRFFGLPGNPVSAMVTFDIVVQPALTQMSGARYQKPLQQQAESTSDLRKRPGRREYQRGVVWAEDGKLKVRSTGFQGSAMLTSLVEGNCYIVLDENCADVDAGSLVTIQQFAR